MGRKLSAAEPNFLEDEREGKFDVEVKLNVPGEFS